MIVLTLETINIDKINIKKPLTYPNNEMTINDVYYDDVPVLIIVKGLQICQKSKNIKLIDTCQSLELLQNLLTNIINRLKNNKKYKYLFNKKVYYSMFESDNIINFKNICSYDTTAFNLDNEKIELDRLKRFDNVCIIVYLKNIWINEKFYGMNIKLSQVRRMDPIGLHKQLFVKDVSSEYSSYVPPFPSQPPPPPPPPPPLFNMKTFGKSEISTLKIKIARPSLMDILNSRGKLRKTNLLS
jgi:hypothetical protein